MKRAVIIRVTAATFAAVAAAVVASAMPPADPLARSVVSLAAAAESNATIYYEDPDGKPFYSPGPKTTPDGRAWRAVPADAELSFDKPQERPFKTNAAEAKNDRKIRYYRNPMGLPDTSPVSKKDSMGDGLHPRLRR